MAFDKIITGSLTRVVKSTAKFELSIDSIINQFKDKCPSKNEIKKIINQKNQITQALNQAKNNLSPIKRTSEVIAGVATGIDTAVGIIKAIPVPTSVPPGIGIPLNVITILSDVLDKLSTLSQTFKGNVSPIPQAIDIINQSIDKMVQKLNSLDAAILKCLNEDISNLTDEEKQEYFKDIGFILTPNDTLSNQNSEDSNAALNKQLQPNSNNPIIYKNFKLELQSNINNQYSFPQRRIQSTNNEGVILYNTNNGQYSFSSSTKILIDEAKFIIDSYISSLK